MKKPNWSDVLQLAETAGDHLVSLYMPTYTGADAQQNGIRYKNLASAAEEKLISRGVKSTDARKLIASATEMLDGTGAWEEQGPSLAVFVGPDGVRVWRLPMGCDEICMVGKHFHVIPLLTWLNNDAPYFVLAVSQNDVLLFYGRQGGIEVVSVEGLPTNLQEALRLDEPEPSRQQHSAGRGTPGKQGLVFHGQGGAPDAAKQEILAFCREIDRALADVLRLRTEPLIFAGVDYLFPIYQEANSYAHLFAEPVTGNPELWSSADIQQRAWPLVESMIRTRRVAAMNRFGNSRSLGQALDGTEEILVAAHAGAVDTLLIDLAARVTGNFDTEGLAVDVDEPAREDGEDLVNLAATLVLRTGGTVEPLEAEKVPGGGAMAAVLRYPLPSAVAAANSSSR
jgi:hypothetical protein